MSSRAVMERDLRMPQFRDADPKDYEFRGDGKVVRKDRWETGIRCIAGRLDLISEWEIADVVASVTDLYAGMLQVAGDNIWADLKAGSMQ